MSNRRWELTWRARLYLWAAHRLYNEFAWAYDLVSWVVSLGHWSRWRGVALDHVTGQRVLELGFGTGELLIEMARRDWQVCGLELSPAMHRVASRKMRRRGVWVPRVRGYAQAMPFADGGFDTIIATFPAGYILSPATLREAARLLRPPDPATNTRGGRFIIAGLLFETDSVILRPAARFIHSRSAENMAARYEQLATAAGFEVTVISEKGKRYSPPILILERGDGRGVPSLDSSDAQAGTVPSPSDRKNRYAREA